MWHITPVISAIWHTRRIGVVVDKAVDSRGAKYVGQVVDRRRIRRIPTQVDSTNHAVMAECCGRDESAESRVRTHGDEFLNDDLEHEQDTE